MFVGGLNRRRPLRFTFLPLALESLPVGDPGTFLFRCVTADTFGTRSPLGALPVASTTELDVTADLWFLVPLRWNRGRCCFRRNIQVADLRNGRERCAALNRCLDTSETVEDVCISCLLLLCRKCSRTWEIGFPDLIVFATRFRCGRGGQCGQVWGRKIGEIRVLTSEVIV